MNKIVKSDNYTLEPHYTKALNVFHYHLILSPEQLPDVKEKKDFRSEKEIINAELNEELTSLLKKGIANGAKYIKVEVKEQKK